MAAGKDEQLLRGLFEALVSSVNVATLRDELARCLGDSVPPPRASTQPPKSQPRASLVPAAPLRPVEVKTIEPPPASSDLLRRVLLDDILDDSILTAASGDKAFPLRVLFTRMGEALRERASTPRRTAAYDSAFSLASALNFYFRVTMDEEVRMRVGLEVSQLYYRFARDGELEGLLAAQVSPLLAALLTTELGRVKLESVDHVNVFDSALHERDPQSDTNSATVRQTITFLARVTTSGVVRARALVRT